MPGASLSAMFKHAGSSKPTGMLQAVVCRLTKQSPHFISAACCFCTHCRYYLHSNSCTLSQMQHKGRSLLSAAACLLLAVQLSSASRDVLQAPAGMLTSAVKDDDSAHDRQLMSAVKDADSAPDRQLMSAAEDADSAFDDMPTSAAAVPLSSATRGVLQAQPAAANNASVDPAQIFGPPWRYVQLAITLADFSCATAPRNLNAVLASAMLADVQRFAPTARIQGRVQPCGNILVSV